jgi:phytoene/squalene synthetase
MARFGVGDDDLREKRFSEGYAALLKFQVERTWELFNRGRPLPALVSGRLAFELRLTWLGGTRILERIEEMGYDTLNARPKISTADKIALLVKSLWIQMNRHRDTETQRG